MRAPLRRWLAPALAMLTAAALGVVAPSPASAAPKPNPAPSGEVETPLLGDVLAATGKRYAEAKSALDKSRKRQSKLAGELRVAEARLAALAPEASQIAAESYRSGKLSAVSMMLNSASSDAFLDRMVALEELNALNNQKLRALGEARDAINRAKTSIDAEVAEQRTAQKVIEKQKKDAEKALALVGGRSLTAGGLVDATSPVAKPGPGYGDGFPGESCNKEDPTTGGCVTGRTLHAYKEVKRAGFNRFVGCYRPGGPYEHPKGRACDWSLRNSGFSPAANNDQRKYGNDLTAFLVRNADRLGILYVIWYRQIWFPATGWSSYSGASDHTDHVHMSML
ncbi:coiled-coil domain-containing protein [Plantactinospora sp. CA-290183]|uniref:coiled-coil domain-containing protein n=1 Tax=Plantactinospora sp. CA-290183 TaxID=3240006 RepID=UPI003D90A586